jgi:rubrerythrin
MKLSNVGNLVQFALDLEAMSSAFYETATTITHDQGLKSLFEAVIVQGQSRIQTLMQLRRRLSLVDVQATIPAMQSEQYRPKTECPPGCPDEMLIEIAMTMEQQVFDFYKDSRDRLGFAEELLDVFEQLGKLHQDNQKKLKTTN